MRLNKIDLNLFVVLDAIYTTRNLTRAAEMLYITQPAVSNALSRLRTTLNDPLFVRTPACMVPTPVTEKIIMPVREALQLLNTSIQEGDTFNPETTDKIFRFSMYDLSEILLLPPLLEYLQQKAPNITLSSYPVPRTEIAKELTSGSLDFCIDAPLIEDNNLYHTPLISSPYVCVVRPDHPCIGDSLSLEEYLQLGHIHISNRRNGIGHVDLALKTLGYKRKIHLQVKNYLVTPNIVQSTDLALTIPLRIAEKFEVKILDLPFEIQPLGWHLYWHKSADKDLANCWLRQSILTWAQKSNHDNL